MNNKHYLGRRVSAYESYDDVGPISGVALIVQGEEEEKEILATGSDISGYVLEIECPYATQAMADNILASVRGKTYRGFRATGARFDPMAELGDAITVNGNYSMMAYRRVNFGANHTSEVSAPGENAVEHEYPYVSQIEKEIRRNKAETFSMISKSAEEILLEVSTLRQNVSLDLEELESVFGTELGKLSENITKTLEGYSTISQTAGQIELAVKESIEYTDQETGKVLKTLEGYSTITQTAQQIESAVSGKIDEDTANSLISQKMNSIELSVSSANGSTTFTLTDGEAELSTETLNLSVNAVNISGKLTASQIDASELKVSAANVTGTLVASKIADSTEQSWIQIGSRQDRYGSFEQYHSNYDGGESPATEIGIVQLSGGVPWWTLYSMGTAILEHSGNTGNTLPKGTWDFSYCTAVGLNVTAVFA